MKLYTPQAVDNLIDRYIESGCNVETIQEGSLLAHGLAIAYGTGYKTAIIQEKYLNEWSSAYTVRFYNEMPKKYAQRIEDNE